MRQGWENEHSGRINSPYKSLMSGRSGVCMGNGMKVLPTRAERNSAWGKLRLGKIIAFEAVRGMLRSLVIKIRAVESYCKVLGRGWQHQLLALKKSF